VGLGAGLALLPGLSRAVHPIGKPISNSTHSGEIRPRALRSCAVDGTPPNTAGIKPGLSRLYLLGALLVSQSWASGVGHQKPPVAPVRGAEGTSGYTVPRCIVPERGQRPEYCAECSVKRLCWRVSQPLGPRWHNGLAVGKNGGDVFKHDVLGAGGGDDAGKLPPEP